MHVFFHAYVNVCVTITVAVTANATAPIHFSIGISKFSRNEFEWNPKRRCSDNELKSKIENNKQR